MPVKSIRADNVMKIRDRVMTLIEKEMKRLNLHAQAAGLVYNPKSMSLKINLSVIEEDGSFEMPETAAFKTAARTLGLRPELAGQTLMVRLRAGVRKCEFVGFRSRANRYPYVLRTLRKGATDNKVSGLVCVTEKALFDSLRNNPGMIEKYTIGDAVTNVRNSMST